VPAATDDIRHFFRGHAANVACSIEIIILKSLKILWLMFLWPISFVLARKVFYSNQRLSPPFLLKEIQMKRIQQGFTLIELMIVVAIIGILAAVAIPSYQDYIARSQVTEAVGLASGFKTPMAEYYADKGHWPSTLGASGSNLSMEGTISGKYVASVAITAGAGLTTPITLTSTMRTAAENVNNRVAGGTITFVSANGTSWDCTGGTIGPNFRPGACK
jgi:type IV pilus assembly protein PilA